MATGTLSDFPGRKRVGCGSFWSLGEEGYNPVFALSSSPVPFYCANFVLSKSFLLFALLVFRGFVRGRKRKWRRRESRRPSNAASGSSSAGVFGKQKGIWAFYGPVLSAAWSTFGLLLSLLCVECSVFVFIPPVCRVFGFFVSRSFA